MKPVLYLLSPDGRMFCPESAMIEGVLKYYPAIGQAVDVRRIAMPRPRPDLAALLGEESQGAPVLVLPEGAQAPGAARAPSGLNFIAGPELIVRYFAAQGLSGQLAS